MLNERIGDSKPLHYLWHRHNKGQIHPFVVYVNKYFYVEYVKSIFSLNICSHNFYVCVWFWVTPGDECSKVTTALHSGIILGGVQETKWGVGDRIWAGHMQGRIYSFL